MLVNPYTGWKTIISKRSVDRNMVTDDVSEQAFVPEGDKAAWELWDLDMLSLVNPLAFGKASWKVCRRMKRPADTMDWSDTSSLQLIKCNGCCWCDGAWLNDGWDWRLIRLHDVDVSIKEFCSFGFFSLGLGYCVLDWITFAAFLHPSEPKHNAPLCDLASLIYKVLVQIHNSWIANGGWLKSRQNWSKNFIRSVVDSILPLQIVFGVRLLLCLCYHEILLSIFHATCISTFPCIRYYSFAKVPIIVY